ncbi:hypothetical protein HAX54_006625, partial [Datura stramonium]|nr:hypothetical protein [Datura stramonium]
MTINGKESCIVDVIANCNLLLVPTTTSGPLWASAPCVSLLIFGRGRGSSLGYAICM